MFQKYIILRDYIHSQLRHEKHYSFLKTFALNAAQLLVPLSLIVSAAIAIISMAYGFTVFGTLFAIIFSGIVYGMQRQRVFANELILAIGIPITVINGFTTFIRVLIYYRPHDPKGDLYSILITVLLTGLGTILIMTGNSGNFQEEITNPNSTDFIAHNDYV